MPWPKPGEHQYRIVPDNYAGFEVQTRSFWMPFWHMPEVNTRKTLEEAEKLAEHFARKRVTGVVKYLGVLPRKSEKQHDRHV